MYMSFSWSDRRIANPAGIFFEKPTIIGENAEVGSIQTQSSNPTQHYMGYLLEHKNEIDNFGELIAPLNVKYIVLAKDVDYQQYVFLYEQSDLKLVMENEELVVFLNLHDTSRIREVTSLIEVTEWSELVEQSKTIDINDYGFVSTFVDADDIEPSVHASAKELNYDVFPLKYHLHESGTYILFTSPDHDQRGWMLDGSNGLDSVGLTSVFTAEGGDIYYKPLTAHIIGSIISIAAAGIILLYPRMWGRT
jgi:hypothetical protein